jgi:hypothetical protein
MRANIAVNLPVEDRAKSYCIRVYDQRCSDRKLLAGLMKIERLMYIESIHYIGGQRKFFLPFYPFTFAARVKNRAYPVLCS